MHESDQMGVPQGCLLSAAVEIDSDTVISVCETHSAARMLGTCCSRSRMHTHEGVITSMAAKYAGQL